MKLFDLYFAIGLIILISITVFIFRNFIVKSYDAVGSGKKLLLILTGIAVILTGSVVATNAYSATGLFNELKNYASDSARYQELKVVYDMHMNSSRNFIIISMILFLSYLGQLYIIKRMSEAAYNKVKNKWNLKTINNK